MPRSVLLPSAIAILLAAVGVASGASGSGTIGPAVTGGVLGLLLIGAVVRLVPANRVLFAASTGVAVLGSSVVAASLTAAAVAADGGPTTGLLGALGPPSFVLAAAAASVAAGVALRAAPARVGRARAVRRLAAVVAGTAAAAWLSLPFGGVAVALAVFVAGLLRCPRRLGPIAQPSRRAARSALLVIAVLVLVGAAGFTAGGQAAFVAVWAAPLAAVPLASALPVRPLARTAAQVGAVAATGIAVVSLLNGPDGDGWLLGCLAGGAGVGIGAALTWVPEGAGRLERIPIALAACLAASAVWIASIVLAAPIVAAVAIAVLVRTRPTRADRATA